MGTLRTSEEDNVVAGEGRNAAAGDEHRRVDEAPKIIIESGPVAMVPPPAVPRRVATPAAPIARNGSGLALVIALYIIGAVALAYEIWRRFR